MTARTRAVALAAFVLWACGQTGTLVLELALPGGVLPTGAAQVRVSLDDPPLTQTVPVGADGSFSLALELDARNQTSQVTVVILDAAGSVLARGVSPPVSIDAAGARVKVFVAPPGKFSPAPFDFPARTDVALAPLSFGAILAGGRGADGTKSDALLAYSVYLQNLTPGAALPSPRAGLAAAGTSLDEVYLFGGTGTGETAAGDLWLFDTRVAPAGSYAVLGSVASLARSSAQVSLVGADQFLMTGAPPAFLNGTAGSLTAFANAPTAAGSATAAATTSVSGKAVVILAGPSGLFRYDAGADSWTTLDTTARAGAAAVTLPDLRVLVAAGTTTTLVSPDGTLAPGPTIAFRDRSAAALAGTTVVLAGGFDESGAGRADADAIATADLSVTRVSLARARGGPAAIGLGNQTVLVLGGRATDGGTPQDGAEIFTP